MINKHFSKIIGYSNMTKLWHAKNHKKFDDIGKNL